MSLTKEPILELADMSDFEQLIRQHPEKIIILDFYATWCGPCKAIAPLYKELATTHKGIIFCKVDVDEAEDLCSKYDVKMMPTFIFTKNGDAIEALEGCVEDELRQKVLEHVSAQ
ncbi:Thioredoxin-1 [Caenorhabditis elegans]|uniref:Isoform b of Thioredoxin-1 n=1 Tax=Caenorhabditis elegans TaxID=6239 RepID=Q09433-2|nr:Thioredoxin-1 [Caenorhabditis elegans]ABB45864.1 TRX-1b [Caenorhabditis elegans]CCD61449.1 Thioredoxin-1 [Caenorhabditis elegans]|eukprot:NP_001021886.1 Thioredoxin-1 [Caenorhabditis elegans]